MKITHKELCHNYRKYLNDKIPISKKECFSITDFNNFFNPKIKRNFKKKIIDHLSCCALCTKDFELILEIKRRTEILNKEIEFHLASELVVHKPSKEPIQISSVFHLLLRYVAFFGGIIFISIAILTLYHKAPINLYKSHLTREDNRLGIILIEPIHKKISKNNLLFKWGKNDLADYYILELFNEELLPIWKSPKLLINQCNIPNDILERLLCPQIFLWMVTGYSKKGITIESQIINFTLIN